MEKVGQIGSTPWLSRCLSGALAIGLVLPLFFIIRLKSQPTESRRVESAPADLIDLSSGTANEMMSSARANILFWGKVRKPEFLFMPEPTLGFGLGVGEKSFAPDLSQSFQHWAVLRGQDLKISRYQGYVCAIPQREATVEPLIPEKTALPPLTKMWSVNFQAVKTKWVLPAVPRRTGIVWCDSLGRVWRDAPSLPQIDEKLKKKAGITQLGLIGQGRGMPRRVVVRKHCGVKELDLKAVEALLQSEMKSKAETSSTIVNVIWNLR